MVVSPSIVKVASVEHTILQKLLQLWTIRSLRFKKEVKHVARRFHAVIDSLGSARLKTNFYYGKFESRLDKLRSTFALCLQLALFIQSKRPKPKWMWTVYKHSHPVCLSWHKPLGPLPRVQNRQKLRMAQRRTLPESRPEQPPASNFSPAFGIQHHQQKWDMACVSRKTDQKECIHAAMHIFQAQTTESCFIDTHTLTPARCLGFRAAAQLSESAWVTVAKKTMMI